MNSTEALDFAIARLDKVRTSRLDVAQQLEEAVTTLRALRQHIADLELARERDRTQADLATPRPHVDRAFRTSAAARDAADEHVTYVTSRLGVNDQAVHRTNAWGTPTLGYHSGCSCGWRS